MAQDAWSVELIWCLTTVLTVAGLPINWQYTLFFYKNVVSPVQTEYSYFSADFRLKILLYYS